MVALDTHMAVMRRRLHSLTGLYFTAAEARDAANRFREKPAPVVAAPIPFGVKPACVPDKIRLVAPGTFPARNFSMLAGRIR